MTPGTAAKQVLAKSFGETGADAVEALSSRMDDVQSEAAPLLAAGDPDRARLAVLLALGAPNSAVRAAVEEVLQKRGRDREGVGLGDFLGTLAYALWTGGVAEEVEALRTKPPAVAVEIQRALVSTFLAPGRLVPSLDATGRLALRDSDGHVLVETPTLPVEVAALLARRHTALVSMNGQRVLRTFATLGHRQTILKAPDPRVLRFPGGLEACAEAAGVKDPDNRHSGERDLATILDAGQHFQGWFPGGELYGLWTYSYQHSSGARRDDPGRPAMLRVVLATALLPDAVYALDSNRWLQPVTPMPPRFGDYPAEWPRQAAFETELIGLLVSHREELVDDGGAKLREEELREAAERVGLGLGRVRPLLDYWSQSHRDAFQLLERVTGGRWHLADNSRYAAARAFLNRAGLLTKRKREARQRQRWKKR